MMLRLYKTSFGSVGTCILFGQFVNRVWYLSQMLYKSSQHFLPVKKQIKGL